MLLNAYICSYEGKQMVEIEMNTDVIKEQMENDEKKRKRKRKRKN